VIPVTLEVSLTIEFTGAGEGRGAPDFNTTTLATVGTALVTEKGSHPLVEAR